MIRTSAGISGKSGKTLASRGSAFAMVLCVFAFIGAYAQTPPAAPPAQPAAAPTTPPTASTATQGAVVGGFNFKNGAPLLDVIDLIANELKLTYVLDPSIPKTATVILNTYGVVRDLDLRQLLETILRMNNLAMVQVGNMYRIVPVANVARLPIEPVTQPDSSKFAEDDHMVLNLVFLHYMTSSEMQKILDPYKGEGAQITSYDPANLLIILDNSRNMRRTLDLINMFDSDSFAGQRVRVFEVKNGQPTDIKKELDDVFKAYSLSTGTKGGGAVQFVALDRINEILAVAPNPGVFTEVESWLAKFDVPAKVTAGAVTNNVYQLKYQRAEVLGVAVGQLYGIPASIMHFQVCMRHQPPVLRTRPRVESEALTHLAGSAGDTDRRHMAEGNTAVSNTADRPMGALSMAVPTIRNIPAARNSRVSPATPFTSATTTATGTAAAGAPGVTGDMTGTYLGSSGFGVDVPGRPKIVPNPFDNTLLVRSTPEQWEEIRKFVEKLDISPRQVLIEAKIYEVDLTGAMSAGVESHLQAKSGASHQVLGSNTNGANGAQFLLSAGTMVGQARELLATLQANELITKPRSCHHPP